MKEKLKYETKKSFKDVPDEVKNIRVMSASCNSIEIEWDAPADNNSKITSYAVYLCDKKYGSEKQETGQDTWIILNGLIADSEFSINVTASNSNGEGYRSKVSSYARTQPAQF